MTNNAQSWSPLKRCGADSTGSSSAAATRGQALHTRTANDPIKPNQEDEARIGGTSCDVQVASAGVCLNQDEPTPSVFGSGRLRGNDKLVIAIGLLILWLPQRAAQRSH